MIFQCQPDRQVGFLWHSCHNSAMWQLSWKLEGPQNCRVWDEGAKEFPFCGVSHSLLLCLFWFYFIPNFCSLPMQPQHGKAKDTCILPMSRSILQPKALSLLWECVTNTPFCASADKSVKDHMQNCIKSSWHSLKPLLKSIIYIMKEEKHPYNHGLLLWTIFWNVVLTCHI